MRVEWITWICVPSSKHHRNTFHQASEILYSVFMTILSLWKHLKTELFLSQWSYWINLLVHGKVIIFLDISSKPSIPSVLSHWPLSSRQSEFWGNQALFKQSRGKDSAIQSLTLFSKCPVLIDPPELAVMEHKWSQTQVRTQNCEKEALTAKLNLSQAGRQWISHKYTAWIWLMTLHWLIRYIFYFFRILIALHGT